MLAKSGFLSELQEYLNQYDLFQITENEQMFYCDKIRFLPKSKPGIRQNDPAFLAPDVECSSAFSGSFAFPSLLSWETPSPQSVRLTCSNTILSVTPLRAKCPLAPEEVQQYQEDSFLPLIGRTMDDWMDSEWIDRPAVRWDKESSAVYLPCSYDRLMALPAACQESLRDLVLYQLDGAMFPFTSLLPAFSVSFDGEDYTIYGHLHDRAADAPCNRVFLYASYLSDLADLERPFSDLVDLARFYLSEKFLHNHLVFMENFL